MEGLEDVLIPIVLFGTIALIIWLVVSYRHRGRADKQQTIRLALEKGAELTPELMKSISEPEPAKNKDLRSGLIWLALGVGLALCGLAVPDPTGNALQGCLAGAAFPFSLGIAYIIMWRYGSRTEKA
ncbi:MAG TPA: DUF6249 domain-containing protein [Woeseiaceae bacterium]|nr:DUF6249 domain-containing protein [Woeseiaceae bacterium]